MEREKQLLEKLWSYLAVSREPEKADIIIAFGGLDLEVPKRASQLYKEGFAPLVLATGGSGKFSARVHGDRPEAETFKDIILEEGVPREHILVENKSQNTGENVKFTMQLLQDKNIDIKKAILVARPFLMRRVVATFKKLHPDVEVIPCPPYEDIESYLEFAGKRGKERILAEMKRIKEYPQKGFMVEQKVPSDIKKAEQALLK